MKKASDDSPEEMGEEMLAEYDNSGGVRGTHAREYRWGYTVMMHQEDRSSTVVELHDPSQGTVVLDPDVQRYFPDSESVNEALRGLIRLAPSSQRNR